MTTELEKQFFSTFGIGLSNMCKYAKYGYEGTEGIWYFCAKNQKECWTYPSNTGCKDKMTSYPQITDRILLELICVINKHSDFCLSSSKIDELKDEILDHCLVLIGNDTDFTTGFEEKIKQQVQALFKE